MESKQFKIHKYIYNWALLEKNSKEYKIYYDRTMTINSTSTVLKNYNTVYQLVNFMCTPKTLILSKFDKLKEIF